MAFECFTDDFAVEILALGRFVVDFKVGEGALGRFRREFAVLDGAHERSRGDFEARSETTEGSTMAPASCFRTCQRARR